MIGNVYALSVSEDLLDLNCKKKIFMLGFCGIGTCGIDHINPLNANPEKWSNTLNQIVGNLPTICLSVFDHFMNLALKGLNNRLWEKFIFDTLLCIKAAVRRCPSK